MVDMVEVVASGPLRTAGGELGEGELFSTTEGQAQVYASLDLLVMDPGPDDKRLDRAVAAGAKARKALDKRLGDEQKAAEREADAPAKKPVATKPD